MRFAAAVFLLPSCALLTNRPEPIETPLYFEATLESDPPMVQLDPFAATPHFALGVGLSQYVELVYPVNVRWKCDVGTVRWTRATSRTPRVVEMSVSDAGNLVFDVFDVGEADVELKGRLIRDPEATCAEDFVDGTPVRATTTITVSEPTGMGTSQEVCGGRATPGAWLHDAGWLTLLDAEGESWTPFNGNGDHPSFPVDVRTSDGKRLKPEPFADSLLLLEGPILHAELDNDFVFPFDHEADVIVEGPTGTELIYDIVGPREIEGNAGFQWGYGHDATLVDDGSEVDLEQRWVDPVVHSRASGGQWLCTPPPTEWFTLTSSTPDVCAVRTWEAHLDRPEGSHSELRTAAELLSPGPCRLQFSGPLSASVEFVVQ